MKNFALSGLAARFFANASAARRLCVIVVATSLVACSTEVSEDVDDQGGAASSQCVDPHEKSDNGTLERATELPDVTDETYDWTDVGVALGDMYTPLSVSDGDVDWYVFQARDESASLMRLLKPRITASPSPLSPGDALPIRVCAFTKGRMQCEVGEATTLDGMNGCCGIGITEQAGSTSWRSSAVTIDLERALLDDTQKVYVRVEKVGSGCQDYRLSYAGADVIGSD